MSAKDTLKAQISAILGREIVIEKPKDKTLAHYATPLAFSLAKELKKSPVVIANELAAKFNSPKYEVSAVNGYINFKLSGEFLDAMVAPSTEGSNSDISSISRSTLALCF